MVLDVYHRQVHVTFQKHTRQSTNGNIIYDIQSWFCFICWALNACLCSHRMAPVRRERSDSSSSWRGLTMECLSIPHQHWPFYAESRPVTLQMPDQWWSTAGKAALTSQPRAYIIYRKIGLLSNCSILFTMETPDILYVDTVPIQWVCAAL